MNKKGSAGGRATAIKNRGEAIKRYYEDPNRCLYCSKIIEVGNRKVCEVRHRKFCGKSCAASYNNISTPKKKRKKNICTTCGEDITYISDYKRKYCDGCLVLYQQKRLENINMEKLKYDMKILNKGGLRKLAGTYRRFRNYVQKHARKVFMESGMEYKCSLCGYGHHVDICHIKPVSSFSDEVLILEINDIGNLAALCPNHHWELDNNLLEL